MWTFFVLLRTVKQPDQVNLTKNMVQNEMVVDRLEAIDERKALPAIFVTF